MLVQCARPKRRERLVTGLVIKPARIIRGKEHRCLVCFGVPNIIIGTGKVTGFQPIGRAYQHKQDCSQKGKF